MSADDYARTIIRVGRDMGITDRGICIALATALVETGSPQAGPNNTKMYANPKVPESLRLPHDAVGSDGYSVGLLQQQVRKGANGQWWWADCTTCMDPAKSTRLFYDRLARLDYNNTRRTPGSYAQAVQSSAYPDRYDARYGDAQSILKRLSGAPMPDYGVTKTMHGYNATSAGIGNSNGPRASTPYFVIHTQEAKSTAVNLAAFCNGTASGGNPVAYNLSIDGRDTVEIVPLNEGPWAAADANNLGIHLCFAGSFASWSRRQWTDNIDDSGDGLNEDLAITRAAKALAAAHLQYGIPLIYAGDGGRNGWPVKTKGVVGHMDFGSRGGGHHDPGIGFPFDELIKRALTGAAVVVNLIDAAAAVAKNWIGARVTKGENVCPDKIGRWAEFANAHIYWTPETGAHPIPHGGLFEAWAEYKWETGPLRYPVRDHAVVKDGGVQAFQGGVLYRKNGSAHGFYVHGEIGKQFAADGYETGRAGWPTTLEYVDGDGVAQDFDNGTYRWSAKAGVTFTARKAA